MVRNRGDGFDDEECPEKETFGWELRSKKAPGKILEYLEYDTIYLTDAGWFKDSQLKLEKFLKEKDILRSAKLTMT